MQKNAQDTKDPKHSNMSNKDPNATDFLFNLQQDDLPALKLDYREPIQMSQGILFNKYFEAFNFYFSKHINEILADVAIPHVILYKDYLYFDDEDEYLKRYYTTAESHPRIDNLCHYYVDEEPNVNKPSLIIHPQNSIVEKRNNKLQKIFLNKLQNAQQMPNTHREQENNPGFKILPKTEDESGSYEESESNSQSTQHRPKKYENVLGEDDNVVHNSFQKMMDVYQDVDDLSYESQEHDVYNPSSSSSYVNPRPTIKDDKRVTSIKINNNVNEKGENKNMVIAGHAPFTEESLSLTMRKEERLTSSSIQGFEEFMGEGSSKLCISDLSDLHLIQKMFSSSDESKLGEKILQDLGKNKGSPQKDKIPEVVKDRVQEKDIKTVTNNIKKAEEVNKMNMFKKDTGTISISKVDHQENKEKPANKGIEKAESKKQNTPIGKITGASSATFAKRAEKFGVLEVDTDQVQSRRVQTEEHTAYPIISVPTNLIKTERLPPNVTVTSSGPVQTVFIPQWAKSPQVIKSNQTTQKKALKAEQNGELEVRLTKSEEKGRSHRSLKAGPSNSIKQQIALYIQSPPAKSKEREQQSTHIQHIASPVQVNKESARRLVKSPSGKVRSDSKNKSRQVAQDLKENFYIKRERKEGNLTERQQTITGIYTDNRLYLSAIRNHERTNPSRSRTEEGLLTNASQRSLRAEPHIPLTQSQRKRITSSMKALTFITDAKMKNGAPGGLSARDGIPLGYILSSNSMTKTQGSIDHSKSIRDNGPEERYPSSSGRISKNISMQSLHKQIRSYGKLSMQSIQGKSYSRDMYDYNNITTRRTTGGQNVSIPSNNASKAVFVGNLPISPQKPFNLNLNLTKLNQQQDQKFGPEANEDNSYGFWTNRSSKGTLNDTAKGLSKEEGKYEDNNRRVHTEEREHVRSQKRIAVYPEKEKVVKSKKVPKVSMYHEFKVRENEMLRNIKNLKPDYMTAMWPQAATHRVYTTRPEEKKVSTSNEGRLSLGSTSKRIGKIIERKLKV